MPRYRTRLRNSYDGDRLSASVLYLALICHNIAKTVTLTVFCGTEFIFSACRAADEKLIYTIDNCHLPGQVFYIHHALLWFSHGFNAADDIAQCLSLIHI